MAERSAPAMLLLVDLPLADAPREIWPMLLLGARRFGANTVLLRPRWQADAGLLAEAARLCARLRLGVALDLAGLAEPPAALLRSAPEALLRDAAGRPVLGPSGQLRAWPLHTQLEEPARGWVSGLLESLDAHGDALRGIAATGLDGAARAALAGWLRELGWVQPLLEEPPTLNPAEGWPFGCPAVRLGELAHGFRADGSARATLWARRPLALLASAMDTDLCAAQAPASQDGMRVAWADAGDVEVQVRHGAEATYVGARSRRAEPYTGMLTYRGPDLSLLHVHVNLGPGRAGVVLLRQEEVAGASFDGDASEGVWLARAMQSSAVFNGGTGGYAPCGDGALFTAAQSGRFQVRRPAGWAGAKLFRLTMRGELLPASCQIDAAHLMLPYVCEDQYGQTDLYMALVAGAPLPALIDRYLGALLAARADSASTAAALVEGAPGAALASVSAALDAAGGSVAAPGDYMAAWEAADQASEQPVALLRERLAELRAARLLDGDQPAVGEELRVEQALIALSPWVPARWPAGR